MSLKTNLEALNINKKFEGKVEENSKQWDLKSR